MIRRLFIDNYRCFSNFELKLHDLANTMIVGFNGVGKSTIGEILGLFSSIGWNVTDINNLLPSGLLRFGAEKMRRVSSGDPDVITLEIETGDGVHVWIYKLVFRAKGFSYEIVSEELIYDGEEKLHRSQKALRVGTIALAALGDEDGTGAIQAFVEQLRAIIVLRPVPRLMSSELRIDGKPLSVDGSNFASWLMDLLSSESEAYPLFKEYLRCVMPDFREISQISSPRDGTRLAVLFKADSESSHVHHDFRMLSDGEKCQFIAAAVIAKNKVSNGCVCFWDEPDNYITTTEVDNLLPALSNRFERCGQLIVTSHSREAIRSFGENEVIRFIRPDHFHAVLPPMTVKELRESGIIDKDESLEAALLNGKVVGR